MRHPINRTQRFIESLDNHPADVPGDPAVENTAQKTSDRRRFGCSPSGPDKRQELEIGYPELPEISVHPVRVRRIYGVENAKYGAENPALPE